jgi:hypothetical protein
MIFGEGVLSEAATSDARGRRDALDPIIAAIPIPFQDVRLPRKQLALA